MAGANLVALGVLAWLFMSQGGASVPEASARATPPALEEPTLRAPAERSPGERDPGERSPGGGPSLAAVPDAVNDMVEAPATLESERAEDEVEDLDPFPPTDLSAGPATQALDDEQHRVGESTPTAPVAAPREDADAVLSRRVETAIAAAVAEAAKRSGGKVNGATALVSLSVVEVETGRTRLSRLGDAALRPASVQKLVTTTSALLQLGVDHHFETAVEAHGEILGGALVGDLVLRASGDPFYDADERGALDPWLDVLANSLSGMGIVQIQGRLVLDEGTFAPPAPGPAWPSSKSYWQEYCALSGGFSANAGCFTAVVTPGAAGRPATTRLRPRHHGLERRGSVKTSRGGPLDVRVGATVRTVTVGGSIPHGYEPFVSRFSHPDPVELCGRALIGGLDQRGIPVSGGLVRQRDVSGTGREVTHLRSPLAPLIVPILRDSNNSLADQVFLHLGREIFGEGTREGGARAVRKGLEELGVSADDLVAVGGSGLSRDNRVTARALTALLVALAQRGGETSRLVYESLPLSGVSGTLERRMRGGPAHRRIRAKTGFINGTSALAGYAETEGGRTLAFALIVNYPHVDQLNTKCWKPMGNAICEALVQSDPR